MSYYYAGRTTVSLTRCHILDETVLWDSNLELGEGQFENCIYCVNFDLKIFGAPE